jgi:CRISPR system Cascade subunit CasD
MPEFLTFTLAAPIAAMGDLAVGERRGTWDRPARSALLGLIAGCLGIDRSEEDAHLALEAGLGLAVRVEAVGPTLADYHTAQVPSAKRGRRFATRAKELDLPASELNTILSRRDYRCDLVAFVAIWLRDRTLIWPLASIADALKQPAYTPYFGRKCCPLSLPMAPEPADADDPVAALAACAARERARGMLGLRLFGAAAPVITLDKADADSHKVSRVEMRRDRVLSRRRWQFNLREEAVLQGPP